MMRSSNGERADDPLRVFGEVAVDVDLPVGAQAMLGGDVRQYLSRKREDLRVGAALHPFAA